MAVTWPRKELKQVQDSRVEAYKTNVQQGLHARNFWAHLWIGSHRSLSTMRWYFKCIRNATKEYLTIFSRNV